MPLESLSLDHPYQEADYAAIGFSDIRATISQNGYSQIGEFQVAGAIDSKLP